MTNLRATDIRGLLLGDLQIGETLGSYCIDAKPPSAGTGILYGAHHVAIEGRRVTIHVIPWAVVLDDVTDLLRELDHPGTPRVFEIGVLPNLRRWVAIEQIAGTTLAELLAHRRLSSVEVVALLRDVTEILAHAHSRGIVHCNLDPEHIIMPDDRRSNVCISGWEGARYERSVAPYPLVRRRATTAPEQIEGRVDDVRTDMFALGVIAYQALHGVLPATNRPPARTLVETLIDHMLCRRTSLRPSSAKVRAAVSWLCREFEVMKEASWIAPALALEIRAELPIEEL
jgi:serine/threonine protein kinase